MVLAASVFYSGAAVAQPADSPRRATVVYTTDVHGSFFPFDFIRLTEARGSMARVATFIDSLRSTMGTEKVVLLDNGDILQGQPTVYYSNFIDIAATNIAAEIYNFLNYDAVTVGNHDIETGHAVYDKWRAETAAPVLAANVIDRSTGLPYFKPYTVIERGGLRIAVIGLLTPAIPAWLPERLWEGLEFLPMEPEARKWVEKVRQTENPDIVIGLFHSGRDAGKTTAGYRENESLTVARNVGGFDAVLMGHDHTLFSDTVTNVSGKTVQVLNPANNAMNVGVLDIVETTPGHFSLTGQIEPVSDLPVSEAFMARFAGRSDSVRTFVTRQLATISDSLSTRDAFFGPSGFMTLLHSLQLSVSGADISMAAPLTFDGTIAQGPIRISDMFTLYKYENFLSTLLLSGREIKDYLEFSYSLWIDSVGADKDHLILFASENPTPADNRLKNPSYNFDSAAGINYTVDVTKPYGQRISITSMATGEPFSPDSTYRVAVNSYRAGGGGDHLTRGAGIAPDELRSRVVSSTDKDLRYYLIREIERQGTIIPCVDNNWKFIPESLVAPLIATDRTLLFSPDSSRDQK